MSRLISFCRQYIRSHLLTVTGLTRLYTVFLKTELLLSQMFYQLILFRKLVMKWMWH